MLRINSPTIFTIALVAALFTSTLPAFAAADAPVSSAALELTPPGLMASTAAPTDAPGAAFAAAVAFLNGDLATAESHALEAYAALYEGASANPRVAEIYAHQFSFMQNPVVNPGFEFPASESAAAFGWGGDGLDLAAGAGSQALVIGASGSARQTFDVATRAVLGGIIGDSESDDLHEALDGGVSESAYWSPASVSLSYVGNGSVTLDLTETPLGRAWATTSVALPLVSEWTRVTIPAFAFAADYDASTNPVVRFTDGASANAADALATSSLSALTIGADIEGMSVDDVVIGGVAYGADPKVAINLDSRRVNDRVSERLFDDGGLGLQVPDDLDLNAHDGYSTVILPLATVPTLFADGREEAAANVAAFGASSSWTFFVTSILHTPSGPRFVAPLEGSLTLSDAPGNAGFAARAFDFDADDIVNLTDAGAEGARFASLYAAQGFMGTITGAQVVADDVTITDASILRARVTHAVPFYAFDVAAYGGTLSTDGFFNAAKLAEPGRVANDAMDIRPEPLYFARNGAGLASYATERRTDANDGVYPVVTPTSYDPLADEEPPTHVAVAPDSRGNYEFSVKFVDYRLGADGAVVTQGTRPLIALVDVDAASALLASGDLNTWITNAAFRICDPADFGASCDATIASDGAGSYAATVPAMTLFDATGRNGGAFAVLATIDNTSLATDAELDGMNATRGAFSALTNALTARADTFSAGDVGPYWLYAAADAASYVATPLVLAPLTTLTDGRAVIITPADFDPDTSMLSANVLGEYVFDVQFYEYGRDGKPLRSTDLSLIPDGSTLAFRLVNVSTALASPIMGASDAIFSAEARHFTLVDENATLRVTIPAFEVPRLRDSASATTRDAPAELQSFAVYASLTLAGADDVPFPAVGTDGSVSGYYSAAKNANKDRALADQLDLAVTPIQVDRAAETYSLSWTAVAGTLNTARDVAARLEFNITNTGSFRERFDLALTQPENFTTAFATVFSSSGHGPGVTLMPGDFASILVDATPNGNVLNNAPTDIDVTATLAHVIGTTDEVLADTITGTVTVAPLTYAIAANPGFNSAPLPGESNTVSYTVSNTGVPESYALTTTTTAQIPVIAPDSANTDTLATDGQFPFTVTYSLDAATKYGSARTIAAKATPDHGGSSGKTASVPVTVPLSALTTVSTATSTVTGIPGQSVSMDFYLNYSGPYTESFSIVPSHSMPWTAPISLEIVGGGAITDGTITFTGTKTALNDDKIVRATFTIPVDQAFNSAESLRLTLETLDTVHSVIPQKQATRAVRVLTGTVSLAAPELTSYVLQGDTASLTYGVTYNGEMPWTFAPQVVTGDDVFGAGVTFTPSTLSFTGTGADEEATFTLTSVIPDEVAYAGSDTIDVELFASATNNWNAALPSPETGTVSVFGLAPTVTFAKSTVYAFTRDVAIDHDFTVSLGAFVDEEATQWATRAFNGDGTVTFDLAVVHAAPTEWSDSAVPAATVTLAPGDSVTPRLTTTGLDAADETVTATVTAQGVAKALGASSFANTEILQADDFVLHNVFVGCYGEDADSCTRVAGANQAISTHDADGAGYSRAYLVTSLIQIVSDEAPFYYDLFGEDGKATVVVSPKSVDARRTSDALTLTTASTYADDDEINVRESGGQFITLPFGADGESHTGIATLLWDTSDAGHPGFDWFLTHLGTVNIVANVSVHGLESNAVQYAAAPAVFPLAEAARAVGAASVLPDKDDPDGDGYWTIGEIRSGSNPLLYTSDPYTDDDEDSFANSRDLVPFLDESKLEGEELFAQIAAYLARFNQPV